jgi:DNA-binding MarR family transcriptional regulator
VLSQPQITAGENIKLSKIKKTELETAANNLKRQHHNIKTDTFLKFLATLDVFNRYLDLHYTSKDATRSGFNVLNTLVLYGGSMSPTQISKKIFRSKNAICHVVSTLESRGLVKTVPANTDRRSVEVHITPKGLALTEKESIIARERFGQRAFSVLAEDEFECLNKILEKILQHTKDLINKPDQDS